MSVLNGLSLSGIIVDIILFIIIVGNAVWGYKRGIAHVVFNICSSLIAIILVFILYKPVTNYIVNQTKIGQNLENACEEKLQVLFEKDDVETTEQLQESESMNGILKIFVGDEITDMVEETKESLLTYLSIQIAHKIVSVIVFFALFTIVRIALYLLKSYIDLLANLPIIRIFNKSGGMIYGTIKGFLIIYAVFAIISLILPMNNNAVIATAIQDSLIGSKMFNHNIILNLIFKFL